MRAPGFLVTIVCCTELPGQREGGPSGEEITAIKTNGALGGGSRIGRGPGLFFVTLEVGFTPSAARAHGTQGDFPQGGVPLTTALYKVWVGGGPPACVNS